MTAKGPSRRSSWAPMRAGASTTHCPARRAAVAAHRFRELTLQSAWISRSNTECLVSSLRAAAWPTRFGSPPMLRSVELLRMMFAWRLQAEVKDAAQAERQRGDYAFHVFLQHKALSDRRLDDAIPELLGQLSQRPPAGAVRRGDQLEVE